LNKGKPKKIPKTKENQKEKSNQSSWQKQRRASCKEK